LGVHLTPGQTHDNQALTTLLEAVDIVYEDDSIAFPLKLAGDKGYRADWIDRYLVDLDIHPVIPSKDNENREDRTIEFDREAYRERNIVERLIGWLKESRRLLTRFEKTAKNYLGMIKMAFIHRYLRLLCG
jgi:transposase